MLAASPEPNVTHFVVAAGKTRTPAKAAPGAQLSMEVSRRDIGGAFVSKFPLCLLLGRRFTFTKLRMSGSMFLEGEHDFQIGKERLHLRAGDSVFAPKRIPHARLNVSSSGGKMLEFVQPAGRLEEFFAELAGTVAEGGSDLSRVNQLFEKYAMKVVGPPLTPEADRRGGS
jgi:hypothetical protein